MARPLLRLVLLVATAVALGAPPALAGNGPPQNVSSISEYVETLPTSSGPRSIGGAARRPTSLPPAAAAAVQKAGGRDTKALTTIATSPALGAPVRRPAPRGPLSSLPPGLDRFAAAGLPRGLGAAVGTGSGSVTALGAVLLALTAVGVVVAVARRR